jgi:hypothetical protein
MLDAETADSFDDIEISLAGDVERLPVARRQAIVGADDGTGRRGLGGKKPNPHEVS